jgi:cystathionine beta-lyase/cystathionine gamma-synthase
MTRFSTKQVHAGVTPDPETGSILTPIYQTTTYVQESVDEYLAKGYSYSRSANPTVRALEKKLNELEGGYDCTCFSSGMAAIQSVMLATLNAGDHAVISDVAYGGTYRLCTTILNRFGVEFTFADTSDPQHVRSKIKDNTRLILTETPANPTVKLTDIAAISEIARENGIPHAVDNTFLTPYYQRPLELGADLSIQFLESHPKVEHVQYPGLRSFPQYDLAKSQASGYGAMLWFEVYGGLTAGKALMDSIKLWSLAENLGSVESLITHPVTMTHADVEAAERKRVGITDGLVRLSVGLEDVRDLIEALEEALEQVGITKAAS